MCSVWSSSYTRSKTILFAILWNRCKIESPSSQDSAPLTIPTTIASESSRSRVHFNLRFPRPPLVCSLFPLQACPVISLKPHGYMHFTLTKELCDIHESRQRVPSSSVPITLNPSFWTYPCPTPFIPLIFRRYDSIIKSLFLISSSQLQIKSFTVHNSHTCCH